MGSHVLKLVRCGDVLERWDAFAHENYPLTPPHWLTKGENIRYEKGKDHELAEWLMERSRQVRDMAFNVVGRPIEDNDYGSSMYSGPLDGKRTMLELIHAIHWDLIGVADTLLRSAELVADKWYIVSDVMQVKDVLQASEDGGEV
jgi:hypothetical protein